MTITFGSIACCEDRENIILSAKEAKLSCVSARIADVTWRTVAPSKEDHASTWRDLAQGFSTGT